MPGTCTQKYNKITINKDGCLCYDITLKWNYKSRTLDISMPGYGKKQVQKYNHPKPTKPQHCPWEPNPKTFGANMKEPPPKDKIAPLEEKDKKYTQKNVSHAGHSKIVHH